MIIKQAHWKDYKVGIVKTPLIRPGPMRRFVFEGGTTVSTRRLLVTEGAAVGVGTTWRKKKRHSPDIGINLKLAMSYTIRGRWGDYTGRHSEWVFQNSRPPAAWLQIVLYHYGCAERETPCVLVLCGGPAVISGCACAAPTKEKQGRIRPLWYPCLVGNLTVASVWLLLPLLLLFHTDAVPMSFSLIMGR